MSRFERWSVWVTSALTVITGTGYFVAKYLMTTSDPYAVVNHPLQPWFLKAHVLVSPLLLFALGLITVRHVWRHFRNGVRWSRKSGITAAVSVVPMVATGYLIQTLTAAGWVRAMAIAHIAFGFLYALGLAAHQWIIRWTTPPPNGGACGKGWGPRSWSVRDRRAGEEEAPGEGRPSPPSSGEGRAPSPGSEAPRRNRHPSSVS